MTDRELKQQLFIRICRDSNFQLNYIEAAILAANILGCSALEIWMAFPYLSTMEEISLGVHPAAKLPR